MRIPGIPYVQGANAYPDGDGRHYGIAIHNTSNTASDTAEAAYADHRPDGVSAHFYVDADSVTQSLDTDARAGHAGSVAGNDNAIAVEITGRNGWTREQWLTGVAWDALGRVLAYLISHDDDFAEFQVRRASVAEMRANPRVRACYSHDDMRQAWGGTTHTDPGPNFPWDRLLAAISAALTATGRTDDVTRVINYRGGMWVSAGGVRRGIPDGTTLQDIYREFGAAPPDPKTNYDSWSPARVDAVFGPDVATLRGVKDAPGLVPHTHATGPAIPS